MENPFLIKKYPDLPGSKPVESAVNKARKAGTKIHDNPERVGAYMDRLEKIAEDERGFSKLKSIVLNRFTINTRDEDSVNKIAEGLHESEKRIAVEQGRGRDIERLESEHDVAHRHRPLILEKAEIQRKTLSAWLDYLQENDAKHPAQFRYFVVRSLGKMGLFDKENATYSKRTGATVAPFPELNSEALGWVYKRFKEGVSAEDIEDENKRKEIERLIGKKDFAKLYAFAQIETAGHLNRETIEGAWKKYDQGSDYRLLEKDLAKKGTGWCTAEGSAKSQLEDGDFYVYYTKGPSGAYTEPRVALRMEGEKLAEVRGVNPRQEIEPELVDIAQKQYHRLPGGDKYDKKALDMKRVTSIVKRTEKQEFLTPDDLRFLYEFNTPIEGFGYERDPRIDQIRDQRDKRADLRILFNCTEEELQEKEHVTLKDIPKWEELPGGKKIKEDFKFTWVWASEYRKGRPIGDFQTQNKSEAEPIAKVFDIGDVIRKKMKQDPMHTDCLTTKEVLEAMDEAGYRPATLEELVAYGRDYWKPDADPKTLTKEERILQNSQAPYIYGLNCLFSSAYGRHTVPGLQGENGKRDLHAGRFGDGWWAIHRFLVLRKSSP